MTEQEDKKWYTDNGVLITAGLRVFTNSWDGWYYVGKRQFEERDPRTGEPYGNNPGGEYFDGWFACYKTADEKGQYTIYNGERMTTIAPREYRNNHPELEA